MSEKQVSHGCVIMMMRLFFSTDVMVLSLLTQTRSRANMRTTHVHVTNRLVRARLFLKRIMLPRKFLLQ
jgi:hypothetical protein